MSVVISSGHGKYIRGASGYLDEVDEARLVVEKVAELLRSAEVGVKTFHDNTSHDQSTNLHTIVNYHNSQSRDLDVSVHFNAYQTTSKPMGVEVLYVTQQTLADKTSEAIAQAGHFLDRGPKKRTDLYFLNNTHEPAVLIETCFVDSQADANLYHQHFDAICTAIAESIGNVEIGEAPPVEPPIEPPIEIPPTEPPPTSVVGTVHGLEPNDVLNIRATSSSSSPIIGRAENNDLLTVIGSAMNGSTKWYKCQWGDDHMAGVAVYGWAMSSYVSVDEDIPDTDEAWRYDITATEFGGGGDEQDSAYPDIDYITGSTRGIALPYKWQTKPRPKVTISGPGGEVTTDIVDLGPWNTNDPDYVLNGDRPLSEQQYEDGTEAQNGQVPTNNAAIDLTPPIASAVGISGKGKVKWKFSEPQTS
jgi:N-acetylmuramoyl-L-alanine amidase